GLKIATAAAARCPNDGATLCDLATVHRLRRSFREAADTYRKAAATAPRSARPLIGLGHALLGAGVLPEALDTFRRALSLAPNQAEIHAGIGHVCLHTGQYAQAEKAFRRALELDPGNATVHAYLGSVLARQGQADAALEQLERFVRLDPRRVEPEALDLLGAELRDFDQRWNWALHAAVRRRPGSAAWHAALGHALSGRRKMQRALECYRHALHLDPRDAAALAGMGWIHCEWLDDWEKGISYYKAAIRLRPNDPKLYEQLGWALWWTDDLQGAEDAFRRGIERGPRSHLIFYTLARMLRARLNDPAGAEAVLRDGLRHLPHQRLRIELAGVLSGQGRTEEAIAEAKRAVEQAPEDEYIASRLARLLCNCTEPEHRRPQEAVEHARRAARAWSHELTATTLAVALCRADRYEEALEVLRGRRVVGTGAKGAERSLWAALAHAKLGRTAEARVHYQKALAELARLKPDTLRPLVDEVRAAIEADG
ncbi:MAG: tetratricopeptide repeat protein, partial [Planctomycetota bacterium]